MTMTGFDCVSIPGAEKEAMNTMFLPAQFCGRSQGLKTTAAIGNTVCSRLEPFQIRFNSDTFENVVESASANAQGVRLSYILSNMNCV